MGRSFKHWNILKTAGILEQFLIKLYLYTPVKLKAQL